MSTKKQRKTDQILLFDPWIDKITFHFSIAFDFLFWNSEQEIKSDGKVRSGWKVIYELRPQEARSPCQLTFRYQIVLHVYTIYRMSQRDVSIFWNFQKFKFSISRQMSKTVDKCRPPEKWRFSVAFHFSLFSTFSLLENLHMSHNHFFGGKTNCKPHFSFFSKTVALDMILIKMMMFIIIHTIIIREILYTHNKQKLTNLLSSPPLLRIYIRSYFYDNFLNTILIKMVHFL